MIVSLVEELLVVEKRLFVIEEMRITRHSTSEVAAAPMALRTTHILLADDRRQLAGIINFGDVAVGDPAQDLMGLWARRGSLFHPSLCRRRRSGPILPLSCCLRPPRDRSLLQCTSGAGSRRHCRGGCAAAVCWKATRQTSKAGTGPLNPSFTNGYATANSHDRRAS